MKNLKKYFSAANVLLLVVMMVGVMMSTSCSKDEDEPQHEPETASDTLVGTWYFTYMGETDYDDYFIFKSNGSGTYHYDDEQSDDFTYIYDSKSEILTLNFKHWESERIAIEWLSKNAIEIGGYGKYVRK